MKSPESILSNYWGYDKFRPRQREIIESVIKGKDTIALLPTGGGKSLCYQVPAMLLEGVCLVVTPLIALMKDQVEQLNKREITAAFIHSGLSQREFRSILDNSLYGGYKFLYLSPERFRSADFLSYLQGIKVSLLAIDEAHCVSQWGFDFRPAYLELSDISELIGEEVPKIALTATATPKVLTDITEHLGLRNVELFQQSFSRTNLNYVFLKDENRRGRMLKALQKIPGSAIVYTRNRRATVDLSKFLNSEGISCDFYHAGLDFDTRSKKQSAWMEGEIRVIVSTNAFGMGIDKADVRQVIHYQIPDSIEAYYQEAGRAGRDGAESWCLLLYDELEKENAKERLNKKYPDFKDVERIYHALCNYYQIAFHSGIGRTFDFELLDFCGKFKMTPSVVHSSLQLLQKLGYMQLSDGFGTDSKVKISYDEVKLYDYQLRNPHHDKVLKLLLRSYGGLFDHYVSINEWEIGKRLKMSKAGIKKVLTQLAVAKVVEYYPRKEKPFIAFLSNRVNALDLNADWLIDNPKRENDRLAGMLNLLDKEKTCREKTMLAYFGESISEDCGRCDVCRKKRYGVEKASNFSKIAEQIESALAEEALSLKNLMKRMEPTNEDEIFDALHRLRDQKFVVKDKTGLLLWDKK
jgi:ATP-dependent DNA helicase RecQ